MYTQGMQVKHRQRPEWGTGSVNRIEALTRAGIRDQRLWIKFTNAGLKTLLDWAVAQSGLDDPLSRFNRTELESFYKDWARDRDVALHRLVTEFRHRREPVDAFLADAPRAALATLQRFERAR